MRNHKRYEVTDQLVQIPKGLDSQGGFERIVDVAVLRCPDRSGYEQEKESGVGIEG